MGEGERRDGWDKAEIVSKVLGAVLIPVVVAGTALWWNSQRTLLQTTAAMTEIAIGILSQPPDEAEDQTDPLRDWAITVLMKPSNPPPLTEEAAATLRTEPLRSAESVLRSMSEDELRRFWDSGQRLMRRFTVEVHLVEGDEDDTPGIYVCPDSFFVDRGVQVFLPPDSEYGWGFTRVYSAMAHPAACFGQEPTLHDALDGEPIPIGINKTAAQELLEDAGKIVGGDPFPAQASIVP